MRGLILIAATCALGVAAAPAQALSPDVVPTQSERFVDMYLNSLRTDPARTQDFFAALPKGADLHHHLTGGPELLLELAAKDGLCIDATDTVVPGPCGGDGVRPAADAGTDQAFHDAVLRAWSVPDQRSAEAGWRHPGVLLAAATDAAAARNESYLQIVVAPVATPAALLAAKVDVDPADLAGTRTRLQADGALADLVSAARADADRMVAEYRSADSCDGPDAKPGCAVRFRFLSRITRGASPSRVFTQMLVGLELAEADDRFAGIELEGRPAGQDQALQSRMLAYLLPLYPHAYVSLPASTPDLADSYQRSLDADRLTYRDLKDLARDSLERAALPGVGLWNDRDHSQLVADCDTSDAAACQAFLAANPKAALEAAQEKAFGDFESAVLAGRFAAAAA